jgi:hypothetical protein
MTNIGFDFLEGKIMAHALHGEHTKQNFLEGFRQMGTISEGCKYAEVSRTAVYNWPKNDGGVRSPATIAQVDSLLRRLMLELNRCGVGVDAVPQQGLNHPVH